MIGKSALTFIASLERKNIGQIDYFLMKRNVYFFDRLSVELLHIVFTYFWAHKILYCFSNISDHIDAVLLMYSLYRINFQSILKCHFDMICRQIKIHQIILLILSDDGDTPGQSEVFLSLFHIEQLTRLRLQYGLFRLDISFFLLLYYVVHR
jgi:hypothetical protein